MKTEFGGAHLVPEDGPGKQALHWLLDAFADGTYAPGDRLPSERELCERAQVSRTTLRPVLAQLEAEGMIGLEGRKRFYRGKGRGAEIANPWRNVVLVYTSSETPAEWLEREAQLPYMPQLIDTHAAAGLHEHGYDALFVSGLPRLGQTLAAITRTPPAGVLFGEFSPGVEASYRALLDDLLALRARGVPVLVVGDAPGAETFDRVSSDQCNGVFKLMRWLAERGCRRILPFWHAPGPTDWVPMRDSGYRLATSELQLPTLPNPFRALDEPPAGLTKFGQAEVYARLLAPFMAGAEAVDAVMATADHQLPALAEACRQLGRRPGEDILLVGYDNTWRAFNVGDADRPAATIDKDYRGEGRALADLLHERLTGKLPATPQIRWIPPRLVPDTDREHEPKRNKEDGRMIE